MPIIIHIEIIIPVIVISYSTVCSKDKIVKGHRLSAPVPYKA